MDHASFVRPCPGQVRSGDATLVIEIDGGFFAAIIDGLGHGQRAAEAAERGVEHLRGAASPEVVDVMKGLDRALQGSVGAAAGVCFVELDSGLLRYAGVGNTSIRRLGSDDSRLVSRDGIVGANRRPAREERMTLKLGDLVLMHTDGVSARVATDEYPELLGHGSESVVREVVRRFGKKHDDAACIALRYRE